jgi:hypothetical protein
MLFCSIPKPFAKMIDSLPVTKSRFLIVIKAFQIKLVWMLDTRKSPRSLQLDPEPTNGEFIGVSKVVNSI